MESEGIVYNPADIGWDCTSHGATPIASAALNLQGTSSAHTRPHSHTPTVNVTAPPFPVEDAAGRMTPVAFDIKQELDKMWHNIQRIYANTSAQIKGTLEPIVAKAEQHLSESYENTVGL